MYRRPPPPGFQEKGPLFFVDLEHTVGQQWALAARDILEIVVLWPNGGRTCRPFRSHFPFEAAEKASNLDNKRTRNAQVGRVKCIASASGKESIQ